MQTRINACAHFDFVPSLVLQKRIHMRIPFVKMHGAGNDFIVLDALITNLPKNLGKFSREVCHRQFGIGADQILIVYPSKKGDFRMGIFNADGGQVEMCGNGIRAFAKYVRDVGHTAKTSLTIETAAGLIRPEIIIKHPKTTDKVAWVRVDMGKPVLIPNKIPVKLTGRIVNRPYSLPHRQGLEKSDPADFRITTVSMGNPHCVIFVEDTRKFPVRRVGPIIENDKIFPKRTNVEFVTVKSREHLIQRTWERGSGETLACGTGASAVCVAGVLAGVSAREVTISLPGGDLDLEWNKKSGRVFKTGPAATVFAGMLDY